MAFKSKKAGKRASSSSGVSTASRRVKAVAEKSPSGSGTREPSRTPKAPKPKKVKAPKPEKAPKPPKKSKTRQKIERKIESKAEHVVLSTLKKYGGKASAAAVGGAFSLPAAQGAAALGAAGTVAAVGIAFGVGYGIGKGLLALWNYFSPEEREFRKARAFREARIKFELEQGRKPSPTEVKEIQRGVGFGIAGTKPKTGWELPPKL